MPEGKAPPIGYLRNLAGVFEWTDVPQIGGAGVVPGYVQVAQCWCSIKIKAGETFLGAAQTGEATGPRGTHTIRTRFREYLTTRHMLEIAGKRYRIVSVTNDDARRYTQLEAELYGDAAIIGIGPPIPRALEDA